jgi:hypothetical protein
MLAEAVKEQQAERVRRRTHAEELRGRAQTAGVQLNRAMTDCVNHQARTIYDNQQLIEKETKALAVKTAKFQRVVSVVAILLFRLLFSYLLPLPRHVPVMISNLI